jgi:hypothetical protein
MCDGWPPEELVLRGDLRECILSKKCVAFIGSGASAGCYDNWWNLVNRLCERCGSDCRVTQDSPTEEYLAAAQDAKNRNEAIYYRTLGEYFGRAAHVAPFLYDALLLLPFDCYATVNLDPLLAMKAQRARPSDPVALFAYPRLDRKGMTGRSIHYLHGMIPENGDPTPGTIVLAQGEFDEAYAPNSSLMNCLVATLENDPVCFIGCGLREPVMEKVFAICTGNQLKRFDAQAQSRRPVSKPPPKFMLLPKPVVKTASGFDQERSQARIPELEEFYGARGIKVVWYVASGSDHSAVRRALEQLAGLPLVVPEFGYEGNYDGQ